MPEIEKVVHLMRGLPACGKSHMARRLAGNDGVVFETDEYFYTQVGDDPASYDYSREPSRSLRDHPTLDESLATRRHGGGHPSLRRARRRGRE